MKRSVRHLPFIMLIFLLAGSAGGGELAELREGDLTVRHIACPTCPMKLRFGNDGKTAYINTSRVPQKEREALADQAFREMKALGGKPPKPLACSLTVTPLPGESHISKSGGTFIRPTTSITSGSGSKTVTRNMKWRVEMRFREKRPDSLALRVFYLGLDAKGKIIKIGEDGKTPTLDKNGCASIELSSPTTRLTRTRTSSSSGGRMGRGFRSTHSTTHGERVTGAVLQLYADGRLVKSWASDSRWTKAAENAEFSPDDLNRHTSSIGVR